MTDQHAKYLEYLDIEELPERYQEVALAIGVEAMVKLAQAFPGVPIYLKQADKILFPAKRRYIQANFTGANHRRLALETGLPLASVYEALKPEVAEKDRWKQEPLI